jgi:hypothetical protein
MKVTLERGLCGWLVYGLAITVIEILHKFGVGLGLGGGSGVGNNLC